MKWVWRILGVLVALLVVAFFVFRVPDTDPDEMRAKYGGEPSQFVEIGDGVIVHLRDEGPRDAQPIILLHGSSADLHTWQPWVDGLSDTHRIIRFDQVGHGLTGPDPEHDYSLGNFVSDIDEVADALGLESFILGGNSMGGAHTVAYALAHPERVDGLILVDAGGADIQRESKGNIGFTIARTPVLNRVMEHITPRSLVAQSLEQSVSNQDVVTDEAIDRYWELLRYPGNRTATLHRFTGDRTPFSAEDVAGITAPTLVMWGDEDALISVDAATWFDTHLPASTLVIYSGIGHLPQEEAPEASIADVEGWLAEAFQTADEPAGSGPAL
jgi:pimeloyl-ACP methyl ester carboxylesterase